MLIKWANKFWHHHVWTVIKVCATKIQEVNTWDQRYHCVLLRNPTLVRIFNVTFNVKPSPIWNFLIHSAPQSGSLQHEATATLTLAHFELVFKLCMIDRTSPILKTKNELKIETFLASFYYIFSNFYATKIVTISEHWTRIKHHHQCDQIWRFIGPWAIFKAFGYN